ncbi:uncharacterized protein TRUGW13939_06000 [Talaromyces rugulosus]|uniref:Peptidase M20 dimerisation domain-containing protein n=1 Tax=Talaromyces rugulosus TaxID=121627 RepID=A0A7H8QXR3_TALRU|nr:uncharacterized protein TRUGW13939_06000 [Talaromyces rugulosus]QKX58872.1 hypothetical protein TRUGW13939_06000 [Talaromyces rugulosus]
MQWSHDRRKIIGRFFPDLDEHAAIYKDLLHHHPELPCQEQRTTSVVASRLKTLGFSVQRHIGGHGVVGLLPNGPGAKVLLRSELDALPIIEATGLPYASKVEQVDADVIKKGAMHACAHDMHMACLLSVAALLHSARALWSGTLIVLFQPNEERLLGAKAMIEDNLFGKIPLSTVCLAQHCVPTKSGTVAVKPGRVLGFLDSLAVWVYGRGAHGATPQLAIDPTVLVASILTPLQTVERAAEVVQEMTPDIVADDSVLLALPPGNKEPIPYVYWNIGVTDPETWDRANRVGKLWDLAPTHSATYTPVIEPTLRTGVGALALSALTFLHVNSGT